MKHGKLSLAMVLGLGAIGGTSQAQFVAISVPLSTNGGSGAVIGNRGDFSGQLGKDFRVLSGITVLTLGAFDSAQDGFHAGTTITVSLYKYTGSGSPPGASDASSTTLNPADATLVTQTTFTAADSGTLGTDNAFRFKSVTPVSLTAGYYQIEADGFNSSDPFQDTDPARGTQYSYTLNTGGSLINWLKPSGASSANRYTFPVGAAGSPAITDNGPSSIYLTGNFGFVVATPEPGSVAMLGGMMISGAGLLIRRRHIQK